MSPPAPSDRHRSAAAWAQLVRQIRLERQWTFRAMARQLGTAPNTVRSWCTGKTLPHHHFRKALRALMPQEKLVRPLGATPVSFGPGELRAARDGLAYTLTGNGITGVGSSWAGAVLDLNTRLNALRRDHGNGTC